MKYLATVLIGALTLTAISPAGVAADSPHYVRRQVVSFADLDLTQRAGAQELYRRIERAARVVCEANVLGGYDRSCADAAIDRALADVRGRQLLAANGDGIGHGRMSQPRQARLDR